MPTTHTSKMAVTMRAAMRTGNTMMDTTTTSIMTRMANSKAKNHIPKAKGAVTPKRTLRLSVISQ
jgi:hypothetical protein